LIIFILADVAGIESSLRHHFLIPLVQPELHLSVLDWVPRRRRTRAFWVPAASPSRARKVSSRVSNASAFSFLSSGLALMFIHQSQCSWRAVLRIEGTQMGTARNRIVHKHFRLDVVPPMTMFRLPYTVYFLLLASCLPHNPSG